MNNITIGGIDERTGQPFAYYETLGGGMGATSKCQSASALHSHMTNTLNTPIEALEYAYPFLVTEYAIRRGSGGTTAKNPTLSFSLDDINELHTRDRDDGLAEDAENDYCGSGIVVNRYLEFEDGPQGEKPSHPEPGATSGEIVWNLTDLSDGFLGSEYP